MIPSHNDSTSKWNFKYKLWEYSAHPESFARYLVSFFVNEHLKKFFLLMTTFNKILGYRMGQFSLISMKEILSTIWRQSFRECEKAELVIMEDTGDTTSWLTLILIMAFYLRCNKNLLNLYCVLYSVKQVFLQCIQ